MVTDAEISRIRLVLMDIDGTLVTGPSDSIENVLTQLRRLKPIGIKFSVATGRTLFGVRPVLEKLLGARVRIPPIIGYNGAVVAWPEESVKIHRFLLPKPMIARVLAECWRENLAALCYVCRSRFDLRPTELVFGQRTSDPVPGSDPNGMPIQWSENLGFVQQEDVTAILAFSLRRAGAIRDTCARLASRFTPELRFTTSGEKYVEIAHADSTKFNAMRVLAAELRLKMDEIMAIGDNFNDLAGC